MIKAGFPKAAIGICIAILLVVWTAAWADYHYADHDGSNEYPYTSWETAADSIQKAIDAASPHDTVYVGAGLWEDGPYNLWDTLALIGRGMDSTIIRGSMQGEHLYINDQTLVQGFQFENCRTAIECHYGDSGIVVQNNRFINNHRVLLGAAISGKFINNMCQNNVVGLECWFDPSDLLVKNNTFVGLTGAGIIANDGQWFVTNNLFHHNPSTDLRILSLNNHRPGIDTAYVANNLFYANYQEQHWYRAEICGIALGVYLENNTFVGLPGSERYVAIGIYDEDPTREIRNCVITDFLGAFHIGGDGIVQKLYYNNLWNNVEDEVFGHDYELEFVEGNIRADPMFIDSSDFHLQLFSPLIDAGDPDILDVDSSRSDIGCYGGPGGESYIYVDLPPAVPDSLDGVVQGDSIVLTWRYNTEADFAMYHLHRDTISGFEPSIFNLIAYPETSLYIDTDFDMGHDYYYRIAAVDSQDNVSDYSAELAVIFTDVSGFGDDNLAKVTKIETNYPNPFNTRTTISYYLADVGYQPAMVQLYIYNLKGQLIRRLVDTRQYPGGYTVVWDGRDDSGEAVASGIYFSRLKVAGLELAKPRKIMLLK